MTIAKIVNREHFIIFAENSLRLIAALTPHRSHPIPFHLIPSHHYTPIHHMCLNHLNVFVGQKFSCNYLPVGECLTHSRVCYHADPSRTDKMPTEINSSQCTAQRTHVQPNICIYLCISICVHRIDGVHKTSIRALNQIEV